MIPSETQQILDVESRTCPWARGHQIAQHVGQLPVTTETEARGPVLDGGGLMKLFIFAFINPVIWAQVLEVARCARGSADPLVHREPARATLDGCDSLCKEAHYKQAHVDPTPEVCV